MNDSYYAQRLVDLAEQRNAIHSRMMAAWRVVHMLEALHQRLNERNPAPPAAAAVEQRLAMARAEAARLGLEEQRLLRAEQAVQSELEESRTSDESGA